MTLRVLELFCGIGGCAAALGERAQVVAAIDVNTVALGVYRRNFAHPTRAATLETVPAPALERLAADLWWLSPPCQPYTRRGRRRDLDDPRARSLLAVIAHLDALRPTYLALENVPGFAGSRAHRLLCRTLDGAGYTVRERMLCPTALGIANRRKRFYLLAGRAPLLPWPPPAPPGQRPLRACLEPDPAPQLTVSPALAAAYRGALDVVDPARDDAVASCFTAAYGRSPVRSGSYLQIAGGLRRFAPREILRLLAFPEGFTLPPSLGHRAAWRLLGNSLSVAAVRQVLAAVPALADEVVPAAAEAI